MPPQKVWFLRRFGVKTDIYFAHFGQCMNVFVVSVPDEFWERKSNIRNNMVIYEFEVDFKKSFIWRSNLCNDDIIS